MSATPLSRRMTAEDAFFLYFEKPHAPLHITTVAIFEGDVSLSVVRENLTARMHLIPRYRQQAVVPPFLAGHPTWEDDPTFTVERHVFGAELPEHATDRELIDFACRTAEVPLPRDLPLWDLAVVQGLSEGRTAFVQRVHMIDGVSAVELALATLDLVPNPPPVPPPSAPWVPQRRPDALESWRRAVFDQWAANATAAGALAPNLLEPRAAAAATTHLVRAVSTSVAAAMQRTSPMIWNRQIGKRRTAGFTSVSFQEVRGIRSALGGTVNDAVLTIVGGALGRYLLAHNARVSQDATVRVMIPVNVRKEDEQGALGNRVSMMLPRIPVGIAEPVQRHLAVRAEVDRAKSSDQAGAFDDLLRVSENAPAIFEAILGTGFLPPGTINLVVTNVPGPLTPLYTAGHRMLTTFGLLPLIGDLGIGIAVGSYDKALGFSVIADPAIVSDVECICEFIAEEFLALRTAAGVRPSDLPEVAAVPVQPHARPAQTPGARRRRAGHASQDGKASSKQRRRPTTSRR